MKRRDPSQLKNKEIGKRAKESRKKNRGKSQREIGRNKENKSPRKTEGKSHHLHLGQVLLTAPSHLHLLLQGKDQDKKRKIKREIKKSQRV